MHNVNYSALSSQKSSAVLVSSVCSSFFPETSVLSCEVDSSGFDIVLKSSHELLESIFLVLQEEVRRQRGKASIRSYSMMLRVLKQYAVKEKKRLGPCKDVPENALVDVCEVNNYCAVLPGPHEEDVSHLGSITLIGYKVSRESDGWLWHIRGASFCGKKYNKVCLEQKLLWQRDAESILEECHALQKTFFLAKGVQCKKRLVSWLTRDSSEWIEELSVQAMQVASAEDLMGKLLRKRHSLKELNLDSAYELLTVQWPVRYREPLGSIEFQTTLVRYIFTPMQATLFGLPALCHSIRLPSTVTITASNTAACQRIFEIIRPELSSDVAVEYDVVSGPFSYIVVQAHHIDGRLIPVSAFVLDSKRKELLLSIPALSLERWLGFVTEVCGTLPPFLVKNRIVFLMGQDLSSDASFMELEKELNSKGIETTNLLCRASDVAKKIVELKQEEVHYVAVIGEKEIKTQSFLFYPGSSKKGYTYTFKELMTFFDGLPIKQEA